MLGPGVRKKRPSYTLGAPNPCPGLQMLGGGGPSPEQNTLKASLEQEASLEGRKSRGLR